jgi:N utilization substance protein A
MNKDLIAVFEYLEKEKGIKRDIIISAIQESLLLAAKKSIVGAENVQVKIHPKNGEIEVFCDKTVVQKVLNPAKQIALKEALQYYPNAVLGDILTVPTTPKDFGRIAAQKARQIISQKLKGAERDVIQEEYRHRINTLVSGSVKRVGKGSCVIVDLGKVEGVMPRRFYLPGEEFDVGDKVLALLQDVVDTEGGGAEVVLSRSSPEFVQALFAQEVPEINDGTVVIENIVRRPGYRTKMIVRSLDQKVDPVGACIGLRGIRIKNIVRELQNEKIDIIPYSQDPVQLLQSALDPVVVRKMNVSEDGEEVSIVVDDDDFPTAIGKQGMNVQLIGNLIGVHLKVQKMSEFVKIAALERAALATSSESWLDESITGLPGLVVDQLAAEGYSTPRSVLLAPPEAITKLLGADLADKILEQIRKTKA